MDETGVSGHQRVGGRTLARRTSLSAMEFRFLREETDLRPEHLACALGVTPGDIGRWEAGVPIPEIAERVLQALYLKHVGDEAFLPPLLVRIELLDRQIFTDLAFVFRPPADREGWDGCGIEPGSSARYAAVA